MSRKENALDLAKFIDKGVRVKLSGGREVEGLLKGYDQLLNLVLDETTEFLRGKGPSHAERSSMQTHEIFVPSRFVSVHVFADKEDPTRITDETRSLGLVVCRGTAVMMVSPTQGAEEISNPFEDEDGDAAA